MSEPEELQSRLAAYLHELLGAAVTVSLPVRLSGGASRETWAFDAEGPDGRLPLILRRDPDGAVAGDDRRPRGVEMRLLELARSAGVPVPRVLGGEASAERLGAPFILMERVEGETIPRRLLRDDAFAQARRVMAADCGRALARIHAIPLGDVAFLGEPRSPVELLDELQDLLDHGFEPHPAFELGLRWLRARAPDSRRRALVHGDFRTGNLIVGPDGLRAVIDWELAHLGDPMEDLGWLCTRAWRFGVDDRPAGGFGSREQLYDAYEAEAGHGVDRDAARYWEVFGTLRWGVLSLRQAARHLRGETPSLELAAIGRRACEQELDLLDLIAGDMMAGRPAARAPGGTSGAAS